MRRRILRSTAKDFYADAAHVFSLRKLIKSCHIPIIIERSSDLATTSVFFNSNGEIDLTSIVTAGGTLGTWLGSDNGKIILWVDQKGGYNLTATNVFFANSGVLFSVNGKLAIEFKATPNGQIFNGAPTSVLGAGNNYSFVSVSQNTTSNAFYIVLSTNGNHSGTSSRIAHYNDRRTNKRNSQIVNSALTGYAVDNLIQDNTSNQKIQGLVADSSLNMKSYKDGALQNTSAYTGTYSNLNLYIGYDNSVVLRGSFQELIIYGLDKSSEMTTIMSEINDYYSVF